MRSALNKNISMAEYFYVLLLLLSSNSICYAQAHFGLSAVLFIAFSGVLYFVKRAYRYTNNASVYIAIFCIMILINRFVFYTDVSNLAWLETIILAIGSYFYFAAFDYNRFRRAFLNVMCVITLLNIIIFLLDQYGMAPIQNVYINEVSWRMVGPFVTGRSEAWGRMAGLWHEPGAFQIYLNSVLLIYAPLCAQNMLSTKEWLKIFIVVLGVILTFSTMGYIVLAMIGFTVALSMLKNASWFYKIVAIAVLPMIFYVVSHSEVVMDKLQQSRDSEVETSLGVRERDNVASLRMAIEHPLTGFGINSIEYKTRSLAWDNESASNGLLRMSAMLGIWWLFMYFLYLYKAVRRLKLHPLLLALIIVILMQSNEAYVQYPISYMFIVQFYPSCCVPLPNRRVVEDVNKPMFNQL